jgi:hypothetical protein
MTASASDAEEDARGEPINSIAGDALRYLPRVKPGFDLMTPVAKGAVRESHSRHVAISRPTQKRPHGDLEQRRELLRREERFGLSSRR